jgi:hypothetical protein
MVALSLLMESIFSSRRRAPSPACRLLISGRNGYAPCGHCGHCAVKKAWIHGQVAIFALNAEILYAKIILAETMAPV